jgi:hypothetical protein
MPYATDNAFSDDVISRYIYGDGGRPSDLTDESIIRRLDNGHTQITEAQYMAGLDTVDTVIGNASNDNSVGGTQFWGHNTILAIPGTQY